jgi:hypothetical protein
VFLSRKAERWEAERAMGGGYVLLESNMGAVDEKVKIEYCEASQAPKAIQL